MGKRLGGKAVGTADWNGPKGYSILLSSKPGARVSPRQQLPGDWLYIGLLTGGGEQIPFHGFFFLSPLLTKLFCLGLLCLVGCWFFFVFVVLVFFLLLLFQFFTETLQK